MAKEQPWRSVPTSDKGDPSPGQLFHSIGIALTVWEKMQAELTMLFAVLVWCNSYPLIRAFGAQISVTAKIDMLRFAARAGFTAEGDKEILERVERFLSEVNSFNQRRNDIAHGVVSHYAHEGTALGYYLGPHLSTTKKFDMMTSPEPDSYLWTAKQVQYYAGQFFRLRQEADALRQKITARL